MTDVIKAIGIWVIILVAAIINGIVREKLLIPVLGVGWSLPISGLLLSVLVLFISYGLIPYIRVNQAKDCFLIGFLWLGLTLVFEFIFGHYILGQSRQEISEIFNIKTGELFSIVLIVTLLSPWLAAKLRGLL